MSLVLVAVPFFAVYTLKINDLQKSLMFAAVLLIAIGCVAVWAKLVKRYGLIPVWRVALITLTIAFIPMYFANSFILAIVCGALIGFGFAGAITTIDLIGAKIMDEDTAKYNLRREGIISNAMGFMNRLNSLFTAAAFFLVGKLFGFVSGDVPGPRPDQAARFLLSVFPCALALIAFVFSFFVDFKETALVTASEEAV
jgi:GPH family glycoside/pentoside/hexuronide:cation symporter